MTVEFIRKTFCGFRFGLCRELDNETLRLLVDAIKKRAVSKKTVLGGRGLITTESIEGLGTVVIKYYKRGGCLRFLVRNRYLRVGKVRPQVEYETIAHVRELGIHAPEPLAYVVQGELFYRGWLVTKQIPDPETLAEISMKDEHRACQVVKKLTEQVSLLIKHGVYHVDLHPGNVVVDRQDRVFLLDFDKACQWRGKKNILRDRYICRWRRAVIKHGLPEPLSEWLCADLRRDYD